MKLGFWYPMNIIAFVNSSGPSVMWHSYLSQGSTTASMPQWIGYDFGTERRPRICQFSMRSRPDNELGNVPKDGPTAYRFQGRYHNSLSDWQNYH